MRDEIRDFLTSRRGRISPSDVGLRSFGPRQVQGLRREEVATLAGVSVEYYARIERGALAGVSEGVLVALAGALRLDDAEREHLHDLARAAAATQGLPRRSPARSPSLLRPGVVWLLDAMTGAAALAVNSRQDVLHANALGRALFAPLFEGAGSGGPAFPNVARFTYLDSAAREFYLDWPRMARECAAALRGHAGRDPFDPGIASLVGELTTRSPEFAAVWASHDVRFHRDVEKSLHHPIVGDLTLRYEQLEVAGEAGVHVFAYTAEPGSSSAAALARLADSVRTASR
ncbi:helix-turn-helix protein [Frondihabitans australicus]|uniref:Helix-turn-helix protein n=1 Tax=Frondihabitans australicus TaxID=386892 RepID=A0A495IKV5_9MICO|nr:helix-turn-helix protein [Frondihabitans australicus]